MDYLSIALSFKIQKPLFFSTKKKKNKKRREKRICYSNSQLSGGSQGLSTKYYLRYEGGDLGENPKGLTLTDGKRNGYICVSFFLGQNYIIPDCCSLTVKLHFRGGGSGAVCVGEAGKNQQGKQP